MSKGNGFDLQLIVALFAFNISFPARKIFAACRPQMLEFRRTRIAII